MQSGLKSLCKKNEYNKINEALSKGLIKSGFLNTKSKINETDIEKLKAYIEVRINYYLHMDEAIPTSLIEIIDKLNKDFATKIRCALISFVVPKELNEFSKVLGEKLTSLEYMSEIYQKIEEIINKIDQKYRSLPITWKLNLIMMTRMMILLKQKLAEYFKNYNITSKEYCSSLFATLAFESKISGFLINNKCCNTSKIHFNKDTCEEINVKCVHRKMLSTIFMPHISLYFKYHLEPYLNMRYNQNLVEMNIIEVFTIFFREIQFILDKLMNFDDVYVIKEFFNHLDYFLIELLKNVYIEESINKACIVLNTILFINQTIEDLYSVLTEKYNTFVKLKVFSYTRKLEQMQITEINKVIENTFIKISGEYGNGRKFINYYTEKININEEFSEDAKKPILEVIMGYLFFKISALKFTKIICENLISDICEIEFFLKDKFKNIPLIKKIKNFLTILVCPTDDKEAFVDNFLTLSANHFTFHQILKAMKNQKDTPELFLIYKKAIKTQNQ
ncbi:hypothetical protein NUSPORA_00156 [Nucleospora cyclopteri]